jgi:uracil-DNA glycosylase
MNVNMEESWKKVLASEFEKPYFTQLVQFLRQEKQAGKVIYPPGPDIFSAFSHTPFSKVKVLLLGQDPYHGAGQAHGLCFSVRKGIKPPPSLQNIYKELQQDVGFNPPTHGELTKWAEQGVFMLNASLTVEEGKPMSHSQIGWALFTDHIIELLSREKKGLVFLLWGRFAQEKAKLINEQQHCILKAAHPSPFSAYNGFFGCKHFSQTNDYLISHGHPPIDWQI